MRTSRGWTVLLGFAGIHDCGMGLYHSFLPYHWRWSESLAGVPDSLTWALFALNFSWSLLVILCGGLVLYAAKLGPGAGTFARRTVFTVGLFWLLHGIYTWVNPLPLPASMAWLRWLLGLFPALVILLHWLPLKLYRADWRPATSPAI